MRNLLRSKIHRAYITSTDADYIGSIIIDRELMDRADLWDYEKVLICDVTNGNRWETYVLPGDRGSGRVSVQGAGRDSATLAIASSSSLSTSPTGPWTPR